MNEEYEYSFKVKKVNDFIDYCTNNKFKKMEDYKQIRTLYKNDGKVMARIAKNVYEDKTIEILNFKDDDLNNKILTISRETADLIITKENKKFVKSLIEILDLNNIKKLKDIEFHIKKVKLSLKSINILFLK